MRQGKTGSANTSRPRRALIGGILETIDIATAILLLSGQITVVGVFVYPKGLFLSLTGPIFNGQRLVGEGYFSNATVNAIDIVVALLLIIGQLRVYGPFPGPHLLSLTVTGPPLGVTRVPVPDAPGAKAETFYRGFRQELLQRFVFRESDEDS